MIAADKLREVVRFTKMALREAKEEVVREQLKNLGYNKTEVDDLMQLVKVEVQEKQEKQFQRALNEAGFTLSEFVHSCMESKFGHSVDVVRVDRLYKLCHRYGCLDLYRKHQEEGARKAIDSFKVPFGGVVEK